MQEDDMNRAWNVFGMSLESVQLVLSYLEGNQSGSQVPGGHLDGGSITARTALTAEGVAAGNNGVSPFITAARSTQGSIQATTVEEVLGGGGILGKSLEQLKRCQI